jgi:serine/threonine protein kinase
MLVIPYFRRERLLNKVVLMKFITEYTNILVPKLYYYFEDNEAIYLVIEYIKGVGIDNLEEEK